MRERERGRFEGARFRSRLTLAWTVALLACGASACTGPGLEPPGSASSGVGPAAAGTGGTAGLMGGDAGNSKATGPGSAMVPTTTSSGGAGNRGGTGGGGFMNTQNDGGVAVPDGGSGEDAGATR